MLELILILAAFAALALGALLFLARREGEAHEKGVELEEKSDVEKAMLHAALNAPHDRDQLARRLQRHDF
ncbi:MAG TPA: hypothetical protein VKT70_13870 [Stellaceae bacterium]|nr:hypothetical protein [Stellaceae bacterium]